MLVKREKSALRWEQNKKSAQGGKSKENALRRKGTLSAWRKRAKDESTSFI